MDIGNTAAPPLVKENNSVFVKVLGKVKDLLASSRKTFHMH